MTAADRPSVTDNARAEAWDEGARATAHAAEYLGTYPPNPYRATGRAETTTATDEDAVEAAARVLYESGTGFKLTKGKPWEELTDSSRDSQRRLAQALAGAGLLATARTRPTETEWGVRGQHTGSITPQHSEKHAQAIANALPYYSVVRREVGPWTEAE